MDISTLSEKSGVPPRALRYVLDHRIIPWVRPSRFGRGRARRFELEEAIALVLAGSLFHFGLPGSLLRDMFHSDFPNDTSMLGMDRFKMGWHAGSALYQRGDYWIKLPELTKMGKSELPKGRPLVVTDINISAIRKLVRSCHEHSSDSGG